MLGAPFSRSSLAFVLGDWYNAVVSISLVFTDQRLFLAYSRGEI